MTIEEYFSAESRRGLEQRLRQLFGDDDAQDGEKSKVYQQRLQLELDVINQMGFAGYFLIVWDFIEAARRMDVPVGPALIGRVLNGLGEPLDNRGEAWAVRLYHKPFIRFIWLGALVMMAGGFLAATDRRYRRRVVAREEDFESSPSGDLAENPA